MMNTAAVVDDNTATFNMQHHQHHNKERAYKAVISLNNAGVSLLQRRLYNEAIETMKDAIRLMRYSFFSGVDSMPTADEFDAALQAAWKRTSLMKHTAVLQQDDIHLVQVSDRDSPNAVYEIIETNQNVLCCVNIDPVDSCSHHDAERLEAESAILLYNYGIAHRVAARSSEMDWDRTTRLQVLETGYQIFELAQSVAAKLVSPTDTDMVDVPSNILLVSVLVTANLIQMSSHSVELSWQYCEILEDLLATISEQEMLLPQEEFVAAAAA